MLSVFCHRPASLAFSKAAGVYAARFGSAPALRAAATSGRGKVKAPKVARQAPAVVLESTRKNIPQSPLKMKFLLSLIRRTWMPDALAQMKFTPKPRGRDITLMLKALINRAKAMHGLIAEELWVDQVFVNKGRTIKRVRIMGRGRHGISRRRQTHVRIQIHSIDFEKKIAESAGHRKTSWAKKYELVKKLRGAQAAKAPPAVTEATTAAK